MTGADELRWFHYVDGLPHYFVCKLVQNGGLGAAHFPGDLSGSLPVTHS